MLELISTHFTSPMRGIALAGSVGPTYAPTSAPSLVAQAMIAAPTQVYHCGIGIHMYWDTGCVGETREEPLWHNGILDAPRTNAGTNGPQPHGMWRLELCFTDGAGRDS